MARLGSDYTPVTCIVSGHQQDRFNHERYRNQWQLVPPPYTEFISGNLTGVVVFLLSWTGKTVWNKRFYFRATWKVTYLERVKSVPLRNRVILPVVSPCLWRIFTPGMHEGGPVIANGGTLYETFLHARCILQNLQFNISIGVSYVRFCLIQE